MLILAGVALRLSLGDNGIINQAKKATEKYQNAQSNEEHYLDTVTNTIEDVRESMHRITAEELSENPKKYYGSYVNYGVDLDGNSETSDWQLFYVGGSDTNDSDDVKGRIYLIAADYVPMNNSTLNAAMGKAKMISATKSGYETLSAYWPSASIYQSLTELETNPTKLFMHEGYDLRGKNSNPNSAATSTLLNIGNWSEFAKGNYGEVAIGGPTLEMWCKAYDAVVDEADGFRKVYPNGNGTSGYYVGDSASQTSTFDYHITSGGSSFNDTQKQIINVFFPHTENTSVTANGVTGNCFGYWLASPSARGVYGMLSVQWNRFVHDYDFSDTRGLALRPIVLLQSEIKLQKNTEKSDDTKIVYDIVK